MTSRAYRGIRIVFFLLLVVDCLLVSQAAPSSSAGRTKNPRNKGDIDEYKKLNEALRNAKYEKKYLKSVEESAKCPFRVLYIEGFIRVLCDCTRDSNPCNEDCQQVYMNSTEINRKKLPRRKKRIPADIEMGCIYVPKQSEHSIETAGPRTGNQVF